ncbi:uncharacterized protein [Dermacentor albipictus]|uniref:uncharacterized protein n=1 Tax=Dermacentor albipictus TaxID=60249 RepID=UPI0038FD2CB1
MNVHWIPAVFLLNLGYVSALLPSDGSYPVRVSPGNGTCDFSGVDAEGMVDAILNRLPVEHTVPDEEPYEIIPGVTVGKFAVYSGLSNLRSFGPVLAYCRDDARFLHVILDVSRGNIRVTLPWHTCEEARGAVGAFARGKFAVTFQVVNETGTNRFKLVLHSGPSPIYVDSVYAFLEDAGPSVDSAFKVLGIMFSGVVKETWLRYVTPTLQEVFKNATAL